MNIGDKYHRNNKFYTVVTVPDFSLNLADQYVEIQDACGTKTTVNMLYFLMNYSKYIPTTLL